MDLDLKMRKAHVQRVNKGKCVPSLYGTIYEYLASDRRKQLANLADVGCLMEISLNYFMIN